jgi:hypothetical protein
MTVPTPEVVYPVRTSDADALLWEIEVDGQPDNGSEHQLTRGGAYVFSRMESASMPSRVTKLASS